MDTSAPLTYPVSDLKQILARLRAMVDATDTPYQTRRFDAFGIEAVQVDYDQLTQIWTVHEHREVRQFQFDDIVSWWGWGRGIEFPIAIFTIC
ncbi:DUF1797 family protein|uniref:DUF1797 family protein n=1 Tax=Leuconostoc lactis TaxID=1246 RepID=A0A6L7A5V9_LEULA|nr:DUF1797 family protein [Leuconostoc lactis]